MVESHRLDPNDWKYRSEGGANIVLAYTGSVPSRFEGKVIRLSKSKHASTSRLPVPIPPPRNGFSNKILGGLLGSQFVVDVERVTVERSFLEGMEIALANDVRPVKRVLVDGIDLDKTEVMMMDDLAFGHDVIGIEIKPKWGFMSTIDHSFESSSIKSNHCRFCMHQYHKAYSRSPMTLLEKEDDGYYCPLDLYSNDMTRVGKGLDALWNQWEKSEGQLNNLKLFDTFGKVLPNDTTTVQRLGAMLNNPTELTASTFESIVLPILLDSSVLSNLQRLQSTYDPIDIEGLAALFLVQTGQSLDTITPAEFVTQLVHLGIDPHGLTEEPWSDFIIRWSTTSTERNLKDLLLAYIVSATFKDCSIFIQLSRSASGDGVKSRNYSIKVIDLDAKPVQKIVHWLKLDREIVASFRERLERAKVDVRKCYMLHEERNACST